jgi:hypothetical protein
MIYVVIALIFLLIVVVALRNNAVYRNYDFDEEDEVTTTTTTTTVFHDEPLRDEYQIVGNLKRDWDNNQPFVIDPVDNDKVWVNSSDDMYEDGAGKIWKLI